MYAQIDYTEKVGNGPYGINEIGCFLTAFCNLLSRFGENIDPPTLNSYFIKTNDYLLDPEDGAGVKDDLSWSSIVDFAAPIHVVKINGPGWPSSNNAIVEFHYKSARTGAETTHFCLVEDAAAHTIVDSWDGKVKSPGEYGEPVASAEYTEITPVPVVTSVNPPTPAAAAANSFEVVVEIPGYGNSNNAANHKDPITKVQAGSYNIYNAFHGMVNVTSKPGTPGSWINPDDNVKPAPVKPVDNPVVEPNTNAINEVVTITTAMLMVREGPSTTSPANEANTADGNLHLNDAITVTGWVHAEDVTGNDVWLRTVRGNWVWSGGTNFDLNQTKTPEVTAKPAVETPAAPIVKPQMVNNVAAAVNKVDTVQVKVNPWQDSYKPSAGTYKLISDVTITDLSGKGQSVLAAKGTIVDQAGIFIKDGVKYARTVNSAKNGVWYGVPANQLIATSTTANTTDLVKPTSQPITDDLEDDLDALFHDIEQEDVLFSKKLKGREQIVADVAKAESFVSKIFNKNRKV